LAAGLGFEMVDSKGQQTDGYWVVL
jgi:hypothetical protein